MRSPRRHRHRRPRRSGTALLLLALPLVALALAGRPARAQITVVNMIPESRSSEQSDDSEPNLAVDPAQPLHMAATAFTVDPAVPNMGAVFLSTNGGGIWTLKPVLSGSVPGTCASAFCDVTLRFGGSSGKLYVSDLTADAKMNIILRVSRIDDVFAPGMPAPKVLETRFGPMGSAPDQPYIQATTVLGGDGTGEDRVYVGLNDALAAVQPKTATVDVNPNAANAPPPQFSSARIEARPADNRDGSSVRTAIHPGGTVYAAFYGVRTQANADIVVVRDDHWGTSPQPFTDLKDAGAVPGIVVDQVPYNPNAMLGTQRVGKSQISIAVDPNNVESVWLAWGDAATSSALTLHLRHSSDGGSSWGPDLRTIPGATNPAVAVNSNGKVGFLYQQLFANGFEAFWITTLEISPDSYMTMPTPTVLAMSPTEPLLDTGNNPIGDYEHLMAVGKDFYGVFSADNTPDLTLFPNNVVYQREHDFNQHLLFTDPSHNATVQVSIDPFFFHVTDTASDDDFFVRDWTGASGHDTGLEPSTNPVFYTTSDVWNRITDTAGALPDAAAPQHEDPQDAMGGQNYAFVRIGRRAAPPAGSPDVQVQAHFLYSDFGAGMAYEAAGTPTEADPMLDFTAAQQEVALADGQGFSWTLPISHSAHVCMAVEIQGPNDPIAPPDLQGNIPGWPATDTAVLYDNNKAQRNIIFPKAMMHSSPHYYALVRNAATVQRDVYLRMDSAAATVRRLGRAQVDSCGVSPVPYVSGNTFVLPAMAPGEVRFLRLTLALSDPLPDAGLPLAFTEVTAPGPAGLARDGFAFAPVATAAGTAARYNLTFQRGVLARLGAINSDPTAAALAQQTGDLLLANPVISATQYVTFLAQQAAQIGQAVAALPPPRSRCALSAALDLERLQAALAGGNPGAVTAAHSDFLQTLDTVLTLLQRASAP